MTERKSDEQNVHNGPLTSHSAAITTEAPSSAVTHGAHHGGGPSTEVPGPQLRIELGRGEMTLTVHWPLSHAQDSATWIRQVLA